MGSESVPSKTIEVEDRLALNPEWFWAYMGSIFGQTGGFGHHKPEITRVVSDCVILVAMHRLASDLSEPVRSKMLDYIAQSLTSASPYMKSNPITAASIDTVDLPEIHIFKGNMNDIEKFNNQANIEKLKKLVEASFQAIASSTGLSDEEVLRVIKDTDVEMQKEVLKDSANVDELREGIHEAIKIISLATGLDTAQISDIFIAEKDDSVDGIVNRLYYRGQMSAVS